MNKLLENTNAFLTRFRVWTINLLTLATVLYLLVVVVAVIRQMPEKVDPEGRVLIIAPQVVVRDQEVYPSDLGFPFNMQLEKQMQARDLERLIRAAAQDEQLAGVLIDFSKTSFSGASTAIRIAGELEALRGTGKPLIAFSESLSTTSYMLAAQADEVYVHPSGAVAISGLGGYRDYTRELTDKLKITIHNYSQGDYKSFVENRTRSDMSPADREQRREIYGPIWSAMKERMATPRGLDPELFQRMADSQPLVLFAEAGYDNLQFAQENGVIDGTRSFPGFRAWMIERFGRDEDAERETYPHIGAGAYLAQLEPEEPDVDDAVSVVFVEGGIQPGRMGPGVAGSDDIARLIRKAYEDEQTRALVVRVNSPGGSIIASDIIRDELVAARSRGLPVVVSMGDVAASGGVWVSTPADTIFAEPTTITGSIGVAIVIPTLEDLMDYIGIHFDGVTTSEYAGWNPGLPVDEKLDALFARWGSSAYARFVDNVAGDREREPDYIRSIAGGRVWLADRALELGLVDELGGLEEALEAAARMASLEEYRVNYVVKEMPPAIALLQRFGVSAGSILGGREFPRRLGALLDSLEGLHQPKAVVMCTECMVDLP